MTVRNAARGDQSAQQRDLVDHLMGQRIVAGDAALAASLAREATVTSFARGKDLLTQDEQSDHMIFVLSGTVDILIGDNTVATIPGACLVGEMALFQAEPRRSATVRAAELTICAEITADAFKSLVKTYPAALERMIEVIKERDPNAVVTLS